MIFISALTGQRVTNVFNLINNVAKAHAKRINTAQLNQFLRDSVKRMSPPAVNGRLPKLYFMTQVGIRPPSFVIKTNMDRDVHFSYQRFLENRLREAFGFIGTPIRFAFRNHDSKEKRDDGVAKVRRILDPGEGLKPSRTKVAPMQHNGTALYKKQASLEEEMSVHQKKNTSNKQKKSRSLHLVKSERLTMRRRTTTR
jgi:GTP-binding protein